MAGPLRKKNFFCSFPLGRGLNPCLIDCQLILVDGWPKEYLWAEERRIETECRTNMEENTLKTKVRIKEKVKFQSYVRGDVKINGISLPPPFSGLPFFTYTNIIRFRFQAFLPTLALPDIVS